MAPRAPGAPSSETLGDLFYRFACAANPDDKQRLALQLANRIDELNRRIDAALLRKEPAAAVAPLKIELQLAPKRTPRKRRKR